MTRKRRQPQKKGHVASKSGQAAYEQLVSDELCMKLASRFARESSKATGDDAGSIRVHYDEIVYELRCVCKRPRGRWSYTLSDVLRRDYETDEAVERFLLALEKWIAAYVSHCIRGDHDQTWKLRGYPASEELMNALAQEYVRDRQRLMRFLSAVFKHWRNLFAPNSPWRVRLVTQQVAPLFGHDRKRILDYLQKIGAVPKSRTPDHVRSWLSRIGQYLSRDQRTAAGKDFGFGRRPKLKKESQ